jgi:hypothetical protein
VAKPDVSITAERVLASASRTVRAGIVEIVVSVVAHLKNVLDSVSASLNEAKSVATVTNSLISIVTLFDAFPQECIAAMCRLACALRRTVGVVRTGIRVVVVPVVAAFSCVQKTVSATLDGTRVVATVTIHGVSVIALLITRPDETIAARCVLASPRRVVIGVIGTRIRVVVIAVVTFFSRIHDAVPAARLNVAV